MTNKHGTGKYLIYLFDVHGTRQHTMDAESYTEAVRLGELNISNPPYASYVVVRIIKNSLDNFYPWRNHA